MEDIRAVLPEADFSRLYSPNVKADVVERSRSAGVGRAEKVCACEFLRRHADAVCQMGGFRPVCSGEKFIIYLEVEFGFFYGTFGRSIRLRRCFWRIPVRCQAAHRLHGPTLFVRPLRIRRFDGHSSGFRRFGFW